MIILAVASSYKRYNYGSREIKKFLRFLRTGLGFPLGKQLSMADVAILLLQGEFLLVINTVGLVASSSYPYKRKSHQVQ